MLKNLRTVSREEMFRICKNFDKEETKERFFSILNEDNMFESEVLCQISQIPTLNNPIKSVIEKGVNTDDSHLNYVREESNGLDSLMELRDIECDHTPEKNLAFIGGYKIGRGQSNQSIVFWDNASGITEERFQNTVLNPHPEDNDKRCDKVTQGTYGIGSHTALRYSESQLIASRSRDEEGEFLYTLFWKDQDEKVVRYLTFNGEIPEIDSPIEIANKEELNFGTVTKVQNPNLDSNPRKITTSKGLRRIMVERPIEPVPLNIEDSRGKRENQSLFYEGILEHFNSNYQDAFQEIDKRTKEASQYSELDGSVEVIQLTADSNFDSKVEKPSQFKKEFPPFISSIKT